MNRFKVHPCDFHVPQGQPHVAYPGEQRTIVPKVQILEKAIRPHTGSKKISRGSRRRSRFPKPIWAFRF